MKRRDFLRKLFGIGAAVAVSKVPVLAKDEPETFKIEDMFEQHEGNNRLYYLKKDSWLNKELIKTLGERYLPNKYFYSYCPATELGLPIKDEYTKADFQQILLYPTLSYHKEQYFCRGIVKGKETGVMRLYKDERNGVYEVTFFEANRKVWGD